MLILKMYRKLITIVRLFSDSGRLFGVSSIKDIFTTFMSAQQGKVRMYNSALEEFLQQEAKWKDSFKVDPKLCIVVICFVDKRG